MRILDLRKDDGSIVLHFATEGTQINAYTLASAIVAIADAAKAANESLNYGYDVELVVEAVGPGSFRTRVRAIYRAHQNLFSKDTLKSLALNVIAGYICYLCLPSNATVNVQVLTDEVIIESGDTRIIVPRNAHEATEAAKKNPRFVEAVHRTLQAVERDPAVQGIGIVREMNDPTPDLIVTRDAISRITSTPIDEPPSRTVTETVELVITRAVLERGPRKWEFMWQGFRISAPILHQQFYDQFDAHRITVAPGDVLVARLSVKQVRDTDSGVYSNEGYEVIEVFKHIPRVQQRILPGTHGSDTPG